MPTRRLPFTPTPRTSLGSSTTRFSPLRVTPTTGYHSHPTNRCPPQATIHTDTLNESGFVDDSLAAIKGRTIHTYHSEGAGGGHAPDIIKARGSFLH